MPLARFNSVLTCWLGYMRRRVKRIAPLIPSIRSRRHRDKPHRITLFALFLLQFSPDLRIGINERLLWTADLIRLHFSPDPVIEIIDNIRQGDCLIVLQFGPDPEIGIR